MDSNTYIDEINLLNNIHDKGINYLITIFNQPNIIHTDINKDQLLFNYYMLFNFESKVIKNNYYQIILT